MAFPSGHSGVGGQEKLLTLGLELGLLLKAKLLVQIFSRKSLPQINKSRAKKKT